jgi:hypothetical protein
MVLLLVVLRLQLRQLQRLVLLLRLRRLQHLRCSLLARLERPLFLED